MAPRRTPRLIKSTELILDQIRVKNFRSIEDQTVSLKPLTIIVGANSSGKSSLLKALLLLAQAQRESKTSGEVPLNGSWVRLEQFKSVINRGDESKALAVELKFKRDVSVRRPNRSASDLVRSNWMRGRLIEAISQLDYSLELGISERSRGIAEVSRSEFNAIDESGGKVLSLNVTRRLIDQRDEVEFLGLTQGEDVLPFSGEFVSVDAEKAAQGVDGAIFKVCVARQAAKNRKRSENLYEETIQGMKDAFFTRVDEQKVLPNAPIEDLARGLETHNGQDPLIRVAELVLVLMTYVLKDMREKGVPSSDEEEWPSWPVEIMIGQQTIRLLREVLKTVKRSNRAESRELWEKLLPMMRVPQSGRSQSDGPISLQMISRLMRSIPEAVKEDDKAKWIKNLERDHEVWRTRVPVPLRDGVMAGSEDLDRFLGTSVHYLGPLRMGPKTAADYELRGSERMIGPEGQHLAYQLMVDPKVWGFRWKSDSKGFEVENGLTSLSSALSYWSQEIGIASSVRGVEEPGVGDSIKMRVSGLDLEVSPNDVGVGVSQTLPVLAVVLLASPGDLVVLEQPELHLHPKSQLELARFFVAAIRSGRRILIESHSEHFLNQLRLEITRSAEDDAKWLAESVGFVFAEKGERGQTQFQQVPLSPDGTLPVWPKGFFDQGSDVIREMIQIRRRTDGPATDR